MNAWVGWLAVFCVVFLGGGGLVCRGGGVRGGMGGGG